MTLESQGTILVTGASGYVGGRLISALESAGHRVRAMARHPRELRDGLGRDTSVVYGDVFEPPTLEQALRGASVAFYLIHSMGSSDDFEMQDRVAARNFANAARACGVQRIVYLGGLGSGPGLSPHLRSRQEVGRILRESGVETIEFRSSVIIGSGSLSYELIRSLVERLPAMVTPRWVSVPTQPIAIEDVIDYLVQAIHLSHDGSRVFEIGGDDQVSYGELMREYARQRGLKRLMIQVPVLTPRLSSLWLGLVTPVYAHIGRKLIDSLKNPTVVRDESARSVFPIHPRGVTEALARAATNEDQVLAKTRWSGTRSAQRRVEKGGRRMGSRIVDSRARWVPLDPATAFAPIERIGGDTGWYFADLLWKIRGLLDTAVGGVGLRRGRRDPAHVRLGDALDFWRVEAFEPDHLLRLRAEMKIPGRAWLQFEVVRSGSGSEVRQTAIFDPRGLSGLAYWYSLYPLHQVVFEGMLRGVTGGIGRTTPAAEHDGVSFDAGLAFRA